MLGMLCLIMSFVSAFSNNKTDLKNTVSSQKESFQVADNQIVKDLDSSSKNTSLKNLKEDSNINSNLLDNLNINLVRNDDDELNGILQSESKKLMNESRVYQTLIDYNLLQSSSKSDTKPISETLPINPFIL